jgi:hypothetical protein
MSPENKGTPEVLTIAPEEFQQMQSAVLGNDGGRLCASSRNSSNA